jgi:hypothetical protein
MADGSAFLRTSHAFKGQPAVTWAKSGRRTADLLAVRVFESMVTMRGPSIAAGFRFRGGHL